METAFRQSPRFFSVCSLNSTQEGGLLQNVAGHGVHERPPPGGGGEVQTAVQCIGSKDIPVGGAEKRRRIGAPVAMDAVSYALNGVFQGRDRWSVGNPLRDLRHGRQIPNQPVAVCFAEGNIQVLQNQSHGDSCVTEARQGQGRGEVFSKAGVPLRDGTALRKGGAGERQRIHVSPPRTGPKTAGSAPLGDGR